MDIDIKDLFETTKIKSSLYLFGIGFGVMFLAMIMIFGPFGGIGIAIGIPTFIVGLIGAILGGGASAGLYMDWVG